MTGGAFITFWIWTWGCRDYTLGEPETWWHNWRTEMPKQLPQTDEEQDRMNQKDIADALRRLLHDGAVYTEK